MNSEAALIAAIIKDNNPKILFEDNLDEYFLTHGDVWREVREYYYKYRALPSIEVLRDKVDDFDPPEVDGEPLYYLDKLRDDYIKQRIASVYAEAGRKFADRSGIEILEQLQADINRLARLTNTVRDLDIIDYEAAAEQLEQRHERAMEMGGAPGITSGIKTLDAHYSTGFAPGHFAVMIGWSGKAKSWMGIYLACKAWLSGFRPMIVSLEMSPEEVRDRAYTIIGNGTFQHTDFGRGAINIDKFKDWGAKALTGKNNFVIVSSEGADNVTQNTVQGKIEQYRPDFIVLDYLGLFDDANGGEDETRRMKNLSRDFKLMAVRNAIPIMSIAQCTQKPSSDTSQPPLIEEVAWSRSIQQDADLALAVHKPIDSNLVTVIGRKNRHGPEFEFGLDWDIDNGIVKEIV